MHYYLYTFYIFYEKYFIAENKSFIVELGVII